MQEAPTKASTSVELAPESVGQPHLQSDGTRNPTPAEPPIEARQAARSLLPVPTEAEPRPEDRPSFWRRIQLKRSQQRVTLAPDPAKTAAVLERLVAIEQKLERAEKTFEMRTDQLEQSLTRLWELEEQLGQLSELQDQLSRLHDGQTELAQRMRTLGLSVLLLALLAAVAAGAAAVAVLL